MASKDAQDIAASPVKDIMAMSEAYKMTKAQFLMSQIDLDPIESQHSQELGQSTQLQTANRLRKQVAQQINGDERSKDNTMLDGSMNSVSQDKSIGSADRYEGGSASPMKRPKSRHGSIDAPGGLSLKPVAIEAEEASPRYDRMT